jgi:hypothetical protein
VPICIPEALTKAQIAHCQSTMDEAEWDGEACTPGSSRGRHLIRYWADA